MKRTVKSFVVERKRRATGASDGPSSIWSKADGDAFRKQAESGLRDEAPAEPATPPPAARASDKPRILQAKSVKPATEAPGPIAGKAPRAQRVAARRPGPEEEIGGRTAEPVAEPATVRGERDAIAPAAPFKAASESSRRPDEDERRGALRAKRAAARGRLPLHERWKWDLLV